MRLILTYLATLLLISTESEAGRSDYQDIPKPAITAEQAVALVLHQDPDLADDPSAFVAAVVWSKLNNCEAPDNSGVLYYLDPISKRRYPNGLIGKYNEWSWFVTFVVKYSGPKKAVEELNLFYGNTGTFQVRNNGQVSALYVDHT